MLVFYPTWGSFGNLRVALIVNTRFSCFCGPCTLRGLYHFFSFGQFSTVKGPNFPRLLGGHNFPRSLNAYWGQRHIVFAA